MAEELYKEFILDLSRHPLNKKRLADFDFEQKEINVSCGDEMQIYVKLDKNPLTRINKKVKDIGFEGQGCAISQAAASLLTEEVKGKSIKEIMFLTENDMTKLLNIKVIYTRKKCALLCLNALQEAIKKYAAAGN